MKKTIKILSCGVMVLGLVGCGKELDKLHGEWTATIENQNIYQIDGSGNKVGGKEEYVLECDGKGNYTLKIENGQIKNGTYSIAEDDKITFKDDNDMLISVCELSNKNEIRCYEKSTYASKYTKNVK